MEPTQSCCTRVLRPGRGTANGKIILLGEHAVVYGRTALAAAIDRSIRVEVRPATASTPTPGAPDPRLAEALACAAGLLGLPATGLGVRIDSNLPRGVGLGSSAALSVALVRALAAAAGTAPTKAAVCAHAFEIEKIFHGSPSGIDHTAATWGVPIAFKRDVRVQPLTCRRPLAFTVAVGRSRRRTGEVVAALRQRRSESPAAHESVFDAIESLVRRGVEALQRGDAVELGTLMDDNHRLLQALGVSTAELDAMVAAARANGALGAKLTGGGGGGAVICLCRQGTAPDLAAALARQGWSAFTTTVGGESLTTPTGAPAAARAEGGA
jgi:hydroxymethylglutaryl-CoA reductase